MGLGLGVGGQGSKRFDMDGRQGGREKGEGGKRRKGGKEVREGVEEKEGGSEGGGAGG